MLAREVLGNLFHVSEVCFVICKIEMVVVSVRILLIEAWYQRLI